MSTDSIKAALTANAAIAIAKGVGSFFTGSASLAAEAVHSAADCGNQLLLFWGIKTSDREADKNHPFGYGMNVYFWSFIVALVLFTVGGAYSIYEGVHKLMHPEELKHVGWAIAVLVFGFIAEAKSLNVCIKEIKQRYKGKSLRWFFKETRDPTLLVIFGEDCAALAGLGIAATCLMIALITGNPMWDAIGSLLVGILLVVVATMLFLEIKELLIGQSVDPSTRTKLHRLLADFEGIEHTYECRTLQMGSNALLLLRIRFTPVGSDEELMDMINRLEGLINKELPVFDTIFVEPDNKFEDF